MRRLGCQAFVYPDSPWDHPRDCQDGLSLRKLTLLVVVAPRPASSPPGRPRSPTAVRGQYQPRAAQRGPAQPVSLLASEAPITSRIASSWVIGEVGLGFNESCCAWESIGTARARCGALDGVPVAELHHCRPRQSRNLSAFNAFAEFQSQYSLRTT